MSFKETRNVLLLMAHTGGGHLRAAEAIAEVLRRRHAGAVTVEMLDALGAYAPFPFNRLASIYPYWIAYAGFTWRWGYRLTDAPWVATTIKRLFWFWVWPRVRRLLRAHAADVIVSVHPLTNHFMVWGLRRLGLEIPLLTVVTDPASVHPFWLSPGVTRCLVGSAPARRKALACGLAAEQVCVTGLPVSPCFIEGLLAQREARSLLGWSQERPAVLLIGGGEGMGALYKTARAIDAVCEGVQLAVVAGRNRRLRARLNDAHWRSPVHVYGFVAHRLEGACSGPTMPRLMSAADLLVSKAGPATLHEAFLAGLPLILNGALPGQEEGNVRLVVEGGAGVWATRPAQVAEWVARWMGDEREQLRHMSLRARALARPHAAGAVVDEIERFLGPF